MVLLSSTRLPLGRLERGRQTKLIGFSHRRRRQRRSPHRGSRSPSACRSWRHCAPPVRSPTPNTRPRARSSSTKYEPWYLTTRNARKAPTPQHDSHDARLTGHRCTRQTLGSARSPDAKSIRETVAQNIDGLRPLVARRRPVHPHRDRRCNRGAAEISCVPTAYPLTRPRTIPAGQRVSRPTRRNTARTPSSAFAGICGHCGVGRRAADLRRRVTCELVDVGMIRCSCGRPAGEVSARVSGTRCRATRDSKSC